MLDARRVSVTINLRYISDGECQVMVIIHNRRPGCDCYWCWRWRWLVVWLVSSAAPGNSGGPRPESWHDHGQVSLIRVRREHCRGDTEWLQYTRVPQSGPAWQTRYIVMMSPETWQETWVTFNTSYWSAFLSGSMVTVSQFVDCWQLTFRNQVIILQIDITRVSCILYFSTSSFTSYDNPGASQFSFSDNPDNSDPDEKLLPDQSLVTPGPGPARGAGGLHHDTSNKCQPNKTFIWCLPVDYNQEKHPFTCKREKSCCNDVELVLFQIFI